MRKVIISHFKEKPKTKTAWLAFGLGLASFFVFPALGISAALLIPLVSRLAGDTISRVVGFGIGIAALSVSISALVYGIKAYRSGERSWVMWFGFVPAILVGLFWIFMIVGESLFPH